MSTRESTSPNSTSAGPRSPEGNEQQLRRYNYEHFRPKHLIADLLKTVRGEGIGPSEVAPEEYLRHLSPLEWEHITLTGVYRWNLAKNEAPGELRPLQKLSPTTV